ncbi:pD-(D/E)xk nuclease superfamily [Caudoviricetes sp.]|nr:pD-(D/E)xk nuclease superfamily [Caudoviricetes sp.]UOF80981.1 pD-(D/E)xk nuclease superfamily [Caudoviricetes sp.]UOF81370.1 pD-(D/E)xk nuclease superfamily [Caudoviricetes sp.]
MIDNSSLQTFKECAYRYQLKYVEGYEKIEKGAEVHHANFGSAIHKGLEIHYKGGSDYEAIESFKKEYPSQLDPEDLAKTQENGIILLGEYCKRWNGEDSKFEVVAVELKDSFVVNGIEYVVKVDMVIRRKDTGELYIVDHKTTGKSLDYNYWNSFDPSSQITGYCAWAKQKYGQCSGLYINAISFGYRKRAYKGEPAGFHCDFGRQMFNRNQRQIEAWGKDLRGWADKLNEARDKNLWLKNMGACRFCSYRPICMAEWNLEEDRELIELQYQKGNPLEYLGEIL